jgi:hypothetical protein
MKFKVPYLYWWIVALLFGAVVLNCVGRQTLLALAPTIQKDLAMYDRADANIVNICLVANGYKRLALSHASRDAVSFKAEADLTRTGGWSEVATLKVTPRQKLEYIFPNVFGAYSLRIAAATEIIATA